MFCVRIFWFRYLNDEDDDVSLAVIPFAIGYIGVLKVKCADVMTDYLILSLQSLGDMSKSQSEILKVK